MAASTSREVVTPRESPTLRVASHSPWGSWITKPRSGCTGSPEYTGVAPVAGLRAARSSCFRMSSSTTFMGRLMMMPSAPRALCSQMKVTLSRKLGSSSEGMATRNWLVRKSWDIPLVSAARLCRTSQGLFDALYPAVARVELAAVEPPYVDEAQHAGVPPQVLGEGREGAGQLDDAHRRIVQERLVGGLGQGELADAAVAVERHLQGQGAGEAAVADLRREV